MMFPFGVLALARWAQPVLSGLTVLATVLVALFGAPGDEAPKKAPAGHVVFDTDRAGANFVARPLKEQYDALLEKLAALRKDIDTARIDATGARREIDRLEGELKTLRTRIDRAKLHIPGAAVHEAKGLATIPIGADDLVYVECPDVELRGWDRPEIRAVVEKTVFAEPGEEATADLDGITVAHRRVSSKEIFGFYHDTAGKPQWKSEWDRFLFKDFLGPEFVHIRLKGLVHEEGNRQISMEMKNEEGAGISGSRWRRQARLVLYVPKCRGVGVSGALGGLKVLGLNAPLLIQGTGDRDYSTSFEVADLGGPLTVDNVPIHRLERVRGPVSIADTAYGEDVSTMHSERGRTMVPAAPRPAVYRDIDGDLRVRACRFDLTIEGVAGRIDIENDFGRTTLRAGRPLAAKDHRIVAQAGTIDLHLGPEATPGLTLFTECGLIQLAPEAGKDLKQSMFSAATAGDVSRSWHGFVGPPLDRMSSEIFDRVANALHGRPRPPGLDVINRSGTILLAAPAAAAR